MTSMILPFQDAFPAVAFYLGLSCYSLARSAAPGNSAHSLLVLCLCSCIHFIWNSPPPPSPVLFLFSLRTVLKLTFSRKPFFFGLLYILTSSLSFYICSTHHFQLFADVRELPSTLFSPSVPCIDLEPNLNQCRPWYFPGGLETWGGRCLLLLVACLDLTEPRPQMT